MLGLSMLAGTTVGLWSTAATASTGSGPISGSVFDDANRNGVREAGEAPFSGISLELYDAARTRYVAQAVTDTSGNYTIAGVPDGAYVIEIASPTWTSMRNTWTPTTTGSLRAERYVDAVDGASATFGLRRIVWSTDVAQPVSTHVGANGLTVRSYNDAVTAREIFDTVMTGTLVGAEAPYTTVLFALDAYSHCFTSYGGSQGSYTNFHADVFVAWNTWLGQGARSLFHEYGHAWSLYYDYIVRQDGTLSSYLQARGLTGDPRVNNGTHEWSARELIAEDYRQLFGSASARSYNQENVEIPAAAEVPGLADFLANTFRQAASGGGGGGTPGPSPSPTPSITVSNVTVNPNPVAKSGKVGFTLSTSARVTVAILDANGSVVRTLLSNANKTAGSSTTNWDRKDSSGRRVRAGSYATRVTAVDASGASATATQGFNVV